jgi:cobalt-zinc-cadmium efflux system membrane fusion protein
MICRIAKLTLRAGTNRSAVSTWLRFCVLCVAAAVPRLARAHDEHDALPSTGATVYKNVVRITPQAEKAIGLAKVKVVLDTWRDEVVINTTVDIPCTRHAYAAALVPGKIAELLVRPGDDVKRGQELARVQSLELQTLQAQLLQASAQHDLSARTLDQRETLAHAGALPERDLLAARAIHREKVAELALLMAKLRAIGFSPDTLADVMRTKEPVGMLPIISPVDGAVSLADVRVGQSVDPTNHIFHLVDRSELLFYGELLESDIWRVREGMPVRIVLASFPNLPLRGKVDHLGLKVDPQRRTMAVRVEMKSPDSRIRPGMFGRMHIEVAQTPEAVVCPAAAVIRRGDRYYVLREQGRNHGKYVSVR